MFHQEADGITTFAASETLIDLFCRGNSERGRFFVVKWTEAKIIGASFLQFYERTNDINDIDPALNLLYRFLADQGVKVSQIEVVTKYRHC